MLREWATTCVQRSEDNLCKLILFFNHVGAQGSNSDSRVGSRHLYLRASHLPGPAQPFSLLIILLETEYTLILMKFNFSFSFGAHVLVYFICLVLICYLTLCGVCLYVCVCRVQSCLPWHTCGGQRIKSTKWVLEIKPGSRGFSMGAFIHWAITNAHLGGRVGMNPLSNPKS